MKTDAATLSPEELNLKTLAQEYADEGKARQLIEAWRWPSGPVCPHCKATGAYRLQGKAESKNPVPDGTLKCKECRKKFTVRVGTIFEDSHIKLSVWIQAFFMMCASKKGISAHQIHRMLGVTYKTAWFMCHRIRHTMGQGPVAEMLKGTVEVDETYVGGKPRPAGNGKKYERAPGTGFRNNSNKIPVVALIQRDGNVRTKVVASVSHKNLRGFVDANIDKRATVNTDQFGMYRKLFAPWARHDKVNHSIKQYARHNADGTVSHVNTCESFFSLIKRGVYGSFHHVSPEHLPKYCDEFAFRWNHRELKDGERMKAAICQIEGKRLMYRDSSN
jgi:transposase-like protein